MRLLVLVSSLLLGLLTLYWVETAKLVPPSLASPSSPEGATQTLPPNRWIELRKDPVGARRGSALRYAPDAGAFLLWGFLNHDYDLLQENPTMPVPEYDMVAFDPADGRWRNHLPREWEAKWAAQLPATWVPRTYSGITSGSERTLFRPPPGYPEAPPRPDLNIVFDQVAYHPPSHSLVYFTGGLTAAYDVKQRRWSDLAPVHSPPPVLGGSLAYDPVHDAMVLFGGGNVAEVGPGGRIVGYTGTWVHSFREKDWRRLPLQEQPPPRMNTRLVCDTRNQVLVVFGGDGHSHYLADTWLFDLKTRQWRPSRAPGGPEPRAGHFTVYDPETGWVILGGGYNRRDLTDLWAYDAAGDRWQRLTGEAPAGFYLSADLAPEKRLILLATNTRPPGDKTNCNVLYPVRTTFAYRLDARTAVLADEPRRQEPLPKRPPEESGRIDQPDPARQKAQAERLRDLPINQWVLLKDPGRTAPTRSWGSATFDSDRGRILYWGGGHCSYGGSDVDAYDVEQHTWVSGSAAPEYPHRQWNLGVRLAGVTFGGNPWTEHGRRIYACDPVSRQLIMVRTIRLTTGYEPEPLGTFPGEPKARPDARAKPPSSYVKYATWSFNLDNGQWEILGPAPEGLDTLVTTPHGVLGVNVDWPSRLNDAGYLLPWSADQPEKDNAVFRFTAATKSWERLGQPQPSPQNLYEITSLAYDSRRDRLLLHGAGQNREELWAFDRKTNRWSQLKPTVAAPAGAAPPVCNREAVYLPGQDVLLTFGPAPERRTGPALWAYEPGANAWYRLSLAPPPGIDPRNAAGQNRALVYDPKRDLVLLVLGTGGDRGQASVYALRYRHEEAKGK
jgi:hypothetical protein